MQPRACHCNARSESLQSHAPRRQEPPRSGAMHAPGNQRRRSLPVTRIAICLRLPQELATLEGRYRFKEVAAAMMTGDRGSRCNDPGHRQAAWPAPESFRTPRRVGGSGPPERRITHALCVRSPLKVSGFTRSGFRAHAALKQKVFCSLALCPAHCIGNSTVKESMPPPSTRTPLPETAFARLRREERHRLDASFAFARPTA